METSFKLNEIVIKRPSKFAASFYNLTKSDRLSNGKMTMSIIAKKRKFFFEYTVISTTHKNIIMNQIWLPPSPWINLTYIEDDVEKTAVTYVGEITNKLQRSGQLNGEWYWTDFNFNLIEQ